MITLVSRRSAYRSKIKKILRHIFLCVTEHSELHDPLSHMTLWVTWSYESHDPLESLKILWVPWPSESHDPLSHMTLWVSWLFESHNPLSHMILWVTWPSESHDLLSHISSPSSLRHNFWEAFPAATSALKEFSFRGDYYILYREGAVLWENHYAIFISMWWMTIMKICYPSEKHTEKKQYHC